MMIMMMIPLFEALHNEGRDASLSNDSSERREMRETVMKGCCHLSLSTCHAVVLIDVLCACLITHSDPETRNQTGGSNCKTIKTSTKKKKILFA